MANVNDIIITMLNHQWSQAKQSEDQRSAMTNYMLVVTAALQGYIVQRGFDIYSIAIALFVVLVGAYGFLVSYKYYERFRLSTSRIGRWMEKLEELNPQTDLDAIETRATQKHERRFPNLSAIRLYWLWLSLHVAVVFTGLVNVLVILTLWFKDSPAPRGAVQVILSSK